MPPSIPRGEDQQHVKNLFALWDAAIVIAKKPGLFPGEENSLSPARREKDRFVRFQKKASAFRVRIYLFKESSEISSFDCLFFFNLVQNEKPQNSLNSQVQSSNIFFTTLFTDFFFLLLHIFSCECDGAEVIHLGDHQSFRLKFVNFFHFATEKLFTRQINRQ